MFPFLWYYLLPVVTLAAYSLVRPPVWLMRPPSEDEIQNGAAPGSLVHRDTFPNVRWWRLGIVPFAALSVTLALLTTDFYTKMFSGAQFTAISVLAFITICSIPTDFMYRLADRWQLRIGLLFVFIASLRDPELRTSVLFWVACGMALLALVLIAMKKSVGASDMRAIQVSLIGAATYSSSLLALMFGSFILMGVVLLIYMGLFVRSVVVGTPFMVKDENGELVRAGKYKVPAVPLITTSYMVGLILAVLLNQPSLPV